MRELEKERDAASKREDYEKALELQKKIDALSLITTPFHRPFEYHVNPNLRIDIRQQELDELMGVLNKAADFHLDKLERIECYDNSNIQGTNATSSMVVLTNGEIDKSQYRRFKVKREWEKDKAVKGKELPNDFEMMKEVLKRRLKHDEWNTPDLIIVDGGKGQVSSALQALSAIGVSIPLVGLAKREETIVIPKENDEDNFVEVSLPKHSKALHLVMRIRDEAHRFAITYHRKLRSKSALT